LNLYLVDTNVWIERLLEQERSLEVKNFLDNIPSKNLFMTDFAFHSIAIILLKLDKAEELVKFVNDAFIEASVSLVHLEAGDIQDIISVVKKFNLDFDDAYQYVAAEKYNLILVSFDSDFDGTDIGRKTPSEILKQM